jgi:hypothetical protein
VQVHWQAALQKSARRVPPSDDRQLKKRSATKTTRQLYKEAQEIHEEVIGRSSSKTGDHQGYVSQIIEEAR